MRDGGELLTQAECDTTRGTKWVQGREGGGESNLGIEVDVEVGRYFAQASVPGFPGRAEGV